MDGHGKSTRIDGGLEHGVRRSRPVTWTLPGIDTDEGVLWLGWVIRLRWVAIVGQVITVSFTFRLLDSPATTLPILAVVMIGLAVANLIAAPAVRPRDTPFPETALLAHLSLDVVALTAFFALAGGEENPFTALYLIHVAMAALMLPARLAVALTGLVLGCYILILAGHLPLHLDRHVLSESMLTRLGHGEEPPIPEPQGAMTGGGHPVVMRDDHHGDPPFLVETPQQGMQSLAGLLVQVARRLVG